MSKQSFSIFALCMIVGMIGYISFETHKRNARVPYQNSEAVPGQLIDFEGMTFTIPESEGVALVHMTHINSTISRYVSEFGDMGTTSNRGTLTVAHEYLTSIANDNSKYVVPIAVNFGGSGEFIYIAYLEYTENGWKHRGSIAVGDRIKLTQIQPVMISSQYSGPNPFTVLYKVRSVDQAMTDEPTLDVEKYIEFVNGEMQEKIENTETIPVL